MVSDTHTPGHHQLVDPRNNELKTSNGLPTRYMFCKNTEVKKHQDGCPPFTCCNYRNRCKGQKGSRRRLGISPVSNQSCGVAPVNEG